MFLKFVVYPVLLLLFSAFSVPISAEEDFYLPYLYATESVVGCADDAGFSRLLQGEPVETLDGLCASYTVSESLTFLGWHFVDPPNYADPDDEFVVARKYVMETESGPVRFIWPDPLYANDFTFEVYDEDLHDEPPEALYEEPPTVLLSPVLRDPTEIVYVRY